jgi:hypothetical protein
MVASAIAKLNLQEEPEAEVDPDAELSLPLDCAG